MSRDSVAPTTRSPHAPRDHSSARRWALAKKAGVSRAYVFRLEAGGADPSVGIVQKLAKALGVPITALLS